MAYDFELDNDEGLSIASVLVAAAPLTMAAWVNLESAADGRVVIGIGTTGSTNEEFLLYINATGPVVSAFTRAGGSGSEAQSTANVSLSTWHHACAVFASATDRRAFLDGANKGTNTTSRTPGTMAATTIGREPIASGLGYDGLIAEAAIWNVALDDAEVAALGKGFCPLLIRPSSLVAYWPLDRSTFNKGAGTTTLDRWKNGHNLTEENTPTLASHPRIYYPSGVIAA